MQKNVLALHDISCLGRCSLTVALPILSVAKLNTSILPTAILSTHTGGFDGFTYRDLTEDISPIEKHFNSLDLKFDALYSGFLGSSDQIEKISSIFESCKKEDSIILVDPVMGDGGKLYSVYTDEMKKQMLKLCTRASIIVPNITEACFLTESEYTECHHSKEYIENLLFKLHKACSCSVVITGVSFEKTKIGAATFDGESISYYFGDRIDDTFHGTGDIFASVLLGAIMNEKSLEDSCKIAVEFTKKCIDATECTDKRYGVEFEKELHFLIEKLK